MMENYTKGNSFNPFDLPKDKTTLRGTLFLFGIENRLEDSLKFIQEDYDQRDLFDLSGEFVRDCMAEAIKATADQLLIIGYYPITEAELELDNAVKHALVGSYKAAFADLRRALELSVLSVFLIPDHVSKAELKGWVNAESNTPYMAQMLTKLSKRDKYSDLDKEFNWKTNLQEFYWKISDFSHNKGYSSGYRNLNSINFHIGGSYIPNINIDTLKSFLDSYIRTIQEIAALLALYNPVILVGLPLDEKFGLEGLASGVFYEGQADLVFEMIPKEYVSFFSNLRNTDQEISGNSGETDHPKPEQTDHLKGWRKLPIFAGEDFQFSADLV